jgi:hypothetical protein
MKVLLGHTQTISLLKKVILYGFCLPIAALLDLIELLLSFISEHFDNLIRWCYDD